MTSEPVTEIRLRPIGRIESPYRTPLDAPRQGALARSPSVIAIDPAYADGLEGLAPGDRVLVLWWAHEADRSLLARPGSNGVFTMRTPHRPNPIGVSEAVVRARDGPRGERLTVDGLDAIDGTPVLDLKSQAAEHEGWTPLPSRVD